MKPIKVIKTIKVNDEYFIKDDIIEPTNKNIDLIIKMNEIGAIEPLSLEEIIKLKREVKKKEEL